MTLGSLKLKHILPDLSVTSVEIRIQSPEMIIEEELGASAVLCVYVHMYQIKIYAPAGGSFMM